MNRINRWADNESDEDALDIFVIVNPNAGGGRTGKRWPAIHSQLSASIGDYEFTLTKGKGHATKLAKDAVASGARLVVAVGGDGTANEAVNGFVDSSGAIATTAALSIIPSGTGCDFGKTFELDIDTNAAIKRIASGNERLIDVGRLQFLSPERKQVTRLFLKIASRGLSGLIGHNINHTRSSRLLPGKARYLIGTLRALFAYSPIHIRLTVDDIEAEEAIMFVAIANGRYFGGGMMVAPDADPRDGRLDVIVLQAMSKIRLAFRVSKPVCKDANYVAKMLIPSWSDFATTVRVANHPVCG